ncbi:MAG: glucosylglycerol 3-phosphatase [Phormidesmis sp.]
MSLPLHQQTLSLDHETLARTLATTENLLIIQDLDGVCMGLVNDPLNRRISPDYVQATRAFEPHFYVLTNGEHTGKRGVNGIIDQAFAATMPEEYVEGYLPGLAAGGVQWQRRDGSVSHPGVSEAELDFLKQVPAQMEACLREFFQAHPLPSALQQNLDRYIAATVLDNIASPTTNLNSLYPLLAEDNDTFVSLQKRLRSLLESLLTQASSQGLENSFFIHYAPNLGRAEGTEIVWFAQPGESGTTDFQFMLRGAIKEAGVLALLNHYIFQRTGGYPLGEDFSAREAPHSLEELAALAKAHFDPGLMPLIVGVGDTVTAQEKEGAVKRGGSDRNFLQLIQNLNDVFDSGNLTVYVDSSGGELKNRKPLQLATENGAQQVVRGPGDAADPLRLNVAFPGGHQQYCAFFEKAAVERGIVVSR